MAVVAPPVRLDVREDMGALGLGTGDDWGPIQTALSAVGTSGGTVVVPPGIYNLSTTLKIFRGTHLIVERGAVLRRNANVTMIQNGLSGQAYGGYTGHGDIRIDGGGVFDCHGKSNTGANNCMSFGHAFNITVADITIKDVSSYHGVEFNGVKKGRVQNVSFLGYVDNSGTGANSFREAVQCDLMKPDPLAPTTSASFPNFGPYDNTCCEDILVENCHFGASGTTGTTPPNSAFGGHSATVGVRHKNIRFHNNHVDGCSFWAVSGYAMTGLRVTDNWIYDCGAGIRADTIDTGDPDDTYNTSNTQTSASQDERGVVITGNQILETGASVGDCIRVFGEATGKMLCGTIADNVIDVAGAGTRGINLLYAEKLTVTGNQISNTAGSGIYGDHLDRATITGNSVVLAGGTGVLVTNSAGVTVGQNETWSAGDDGIQVSSSSDFKILGNTTRQSGTHGINVVTSCSDFLVLGNEVKGASRAAAGVSSAFRTSGSCVRGTWDNNRARRWGSGNEYLNGFSATNTCSAMKRPGGNVFQDGTAAGSAIADSSVSPDVTTADTTVA